MPRRAEPRARRRDAGAARGLRAVAPDSGPAGRRVRWRASEPRRQEQKTRPKPGWMRESRGVSPASSLRACCQSGKARPQPGSTPSLLPVPQGQQGQQGQQVRRPSWQPSSPQAFWQQASWQRRPSWPERPSWQQPSSPEQRPSWPEQQPSSPERRPSLPEQRPSSPEQRPSSPEQQPSLPEQQPSLPEQRPSSPEQQPSWPERPSSPEPPSWPEPPSSPERPSGPGLSWPERPFSQLP